MANVIVTIGAIMFVAGACSIGYGARIIQVEEGWASVIAGSTLVAGGMVTIGLGLVMRLLRQLKAAIMERPVAQGFEAPPTILPPPAVDVPPVSEELLTPAPIADEAPSAVLPDEPKSEIATDEAVVAKPPILRPTLRKPPSAEEPVAAAEALPAAPEHVEAYDQSAEQPEPAVHPADDFKHETPSSPEHDLPPPVEPAPEPALPATVTPPKEDDWLDQALARIDEELPIRAPGRHVGVPGPDNAPPARIVAKPAKPTLPKIDAKSAEAKPLETTPTAPTSAVIGRYEADGTSYVMYADGSIEAQSEAGVFRFGSMAELRAHIEG